MRSGTEWLDARMNFITGTDVAKILGFDPYTSRSMALKNKLGFQPVEQSEYTKSIMEFGRACEPLAIESFKLYNLNPITCTLESGYLIVDDIYPFLAGTPDVIISTKSEYWVTQNIQNYAKFMEYYNSSLKAQSKCIDGSNKFILEIKCRTYPTVNMAIPYRFKSDADHYTGVSGEMPVKDWLQLQHYLYLHKLPFGYLYSWVISGEGTSYCIRAERTFYEQRVIPVLKEFYDILQRCKLTPELIIQSIAELRYCKTSIKITESEILDTIKSSIIYEYRHTAYVGHKPPV